MYTHTHHDGHTEISVMIYPTSGLITIRIRLIPGYLSWSRPNARGIRTIIDRAIRESDTPTIRRTGRVTITPTSDGWFGQVDTTTVPRT